MTNFSLYRDPVDFLLKIYINLSHKHIADITSQYNMYASSWVDITVHESNKVEKKNCWGVLGKKKNEKQLGEKRRYQKLR